MMESVRPYEQAVSGLAPSLRGRLLTLPHSVVAQAQELRLLLGQPPILRACNRSQCYRNLAPVTAQELSQSLLTLSGQALHTHQMEIAQGFLTLPGGHRAGFAATAVHDAVGRTVNLREINAIVLRIARAFPGAADSGIGQAFSQGVRGLLIAGAPSSGKTTLLRELARKLAEGAVSGCDRVAVVDERGELSGFCDGCCVLRGYEKGAGMLLAIRSLAPQVILCDELGTLQDVEAVSQALHSGVAVVTTIHAGSREELLRREAGRRLLASGGFETVILLGESPHPGVIREVFSVDELIETSGIAFAGGQLHSGRRHPGIRLSPAVCGA